MSPRHAVRHSSGAFICNSGHVFPLFTASESLYNKIPLKRFDLADYICPARGIYTRIII